MGTAAAPRIEFRNCSASVRVNFELSWPEVSNKSHRHFPCNRIDANLDQRMLIDAASCHNEPTGGRPSTLWRPPRSKTRKKTRHGKAMQTSSLPGLIAPMALLAHLNLAKQWKIIDTCLLTFCI